jgi:hypothetical protein
MFGLACKYIQKLHHGDSQIDPNGIMEKAILVNLPAATLKDLFFLNYIGEIPLAMAIVNHHSSRSPKFTLSRRNISRARRYSSYFVGVRLWRSSRFGQQRVTATRILNSRMPL